MRYLPLLLVASCAATQTSETTLDVDPGSEEAAHAHFIQGFAGVSDLGTAGGNGPIPGGEFFGGDIEEAPFLGGALQWGLGRFEKFDVGIEGGATLTAGVYNGNASVGGVSQAVDADLVGGSLFLGAFASREFSGWRAYGGLGPLLQLMRFDIDLNESFGVPGTFGDDATGFGYYIRLGIERRISDGLLLGAGARWIDADLDFSDEFGGVDYSGGQLFVTLSRSF